MKVFYSTCFKPNFFFIFANRVYVRVRNFYTIGSGDYQKKKRRKEKINETKKKEKLIKSSDEHS